MAHNHEVSISPFENCIQDPQAILSKSLQDNNIREFKIALEMDADPTRIDETTRMSIFEKALQTFGCADFVEECIKRGCKYDYTNRYLNKRPINFAADSRDPRILAHLLKGNQVDVDVQYANLTPLNSLTKNVTPENYENVFECIRLLVAADASPNVPDQREMTPILHIINNKKLGNDQKKEIIRHFLSNSQVDLDSFRDGEARERLNSRFPEILLPAEKNDVHNFEALLIFLKNGNEEKFIKAFNEYDVLNNSSEKDNQQNVIQEQNTRLLIAAIKKGLNEAVNVILKTGVNVNLVERGSTPIEIACTFGNWEALQKLIDHEDLKLRNYENLLITVTKKLEEVSYNKFCNYYKCFYTLLESNKIDINEIDKSGTTALHYAVKYKNDKAIKELLKRGAYIGSKSRFNDLPISEISPDILEEYFDSCITTNGLKTGDDNFEIVINFSSLISADPASKACKTQKVRQEMLPIEHMAASKELRHLLNHPLITSFLFLKWHRLSIVFYINFILYALFWVSLVTYIMLNYNRSTDETVIYVFRVFSFIGLIYMLIRELSQFVISPWAFLRAPVNYMEVILIILTIVTLSEPNYLKETQRVIAVFTILIASVELCLLVGSLPVLSISTHMLMLKAVSTSFLKSFTLYSIFVITFSLCFYILFGNIGTSAVTSGDANAGSTVETGVDNGAVSDADGDGEFNKFLNPFTAIIKTIVMLTGEFDAGDIKFHSFTSYLVFLLFVFFMSIVLFNLLNGLAVSDTQAIKSQAELNGSICRTNLLASYERVLIGRNNVTGLLVNLRPFRTIFQRLTNLFPDCISGKYIVITPNDKNKIFTPVLENQKNDVALLPNNGNVFRSFKNDLEKERQLLDAPVKILPCCCNWAGNCSQMDLKTVKTALWILEKKDKANKNQQKIQDTENRLKKIETKIDEVLVLLQEIATK